MFSRRRPVPVAIGALLLTGCGATAEAPADAPDDAPLDVLASFYPLEYAAEQVGGELVQVSSLTPPGAEPHDLELSPRQLRGVADADVVLYLSGFQPAVDEAVDARSPEHALDVAEVADLRPPVTDADHDHDHDGVQDHAAADHADEDADEHTDEHADEPSEAHVEDAAGEPADDGHRHGSLDPHFWLDPVRMAAVGHEVARVLAEASPEHAGTFSERAAAFEEEMLALDASYTAGLAQCERDVVVSTHAAFGYLTERYGLGLVAVAGIDPDTEPSPARIREVADVVRDRGVTTVYAETLLGPAVAETLARDLGLRTDVLDPLESLSDEATDYRGVMGANLEALRTGLGCS